MSRAEIIHKAIAKAEANDFPHEKYVFALKKFDDGWHLYDGAWLEHIIFSHDFARAFWGEKDFRHPYMMITLSGKAVWQYHLQQMVLEEDPIKYLEKFI